MAAASLTYICTFFLVIRATVLNYDTDIGLVDRVIRSPVDRELDRDSERDFDHLPISTVLDMMV